MTYSSEGDRSVLAPWQTLDRRQVYSAPPWVEVFVERVQLPDGRIVDDYHQVNMGHHVGIVAHTDEGKVLLERQYKHGIGRVNLVLPGGGIEANEEPIEAARRELREETGYQAGEWEYMGGFVTSASYGCGKIHLFAAHHLTSIAVPDSGDLEEIELVVLSVEQVFAAVRRGEIASLGAVMALALALNPLFKS